MLNRNRNDQLVQEAERKRRAQNLIIHGVQEVDAEKQKVNDENFITLFLREIGVETTPESIVRLGKTETNKTRPLKIKLKSEAEKDTIMSRLPNLKNAEDVFRRISVTDDHTIEEKQEKKRLVDGSKEKNRNETNAVWKNNFFRSSSKLKYDHQLNRKDIDWNMVTATSHDDNNFIEAVMDSYLTQHVLTPTRGRGTNEPSLIDLVFSRNAECIESIELHAPLGKSDHSLIKLMYRPN